MENKLKELIENCEKQSGIKLSEHIKQSIKLGYNTGYSDGLQDSLENMNNIKVEKTTTRI